MKNIARRGLLQSLFCLGSLASLAVGLTLSNGDVFTVEATTCATTPTGIVSWYRAENSADDSIGPNNGNLQNAVSFASGKVGQAFSFDATNNEGVLVSSSASLNPTEAITLEAWVNPSSYPNTAPTVLRKNVNTVGTTQYSLLIGDGFTAGVAHCNIGGFAGPVGGLIPLNQWTHLACTYDRQNVRLYVNGIEVGSSAATQSIPVSNQSLGIGTEPRFSDRNFDGLIDEATIYNRALSSSEIQTLFNADNAGKCVPAEVLQAVLNVSPGTVGCGEPVQLDGSSSTAASGRQIFSYQWNFDDGNGPLTTIEPTIQHSYSDFGVYHPTLTVQDDQGDVSTAAQATVRHLDNNAPIAVVQAPTSITPGQVVNFDGSQSSDPDSACGGHVVSWRWQVDSGNPVVTSSPTISSSSFATQLTGGTHTLTLVVFDDSGNQSEAAAQSLTVGVLPVATLTINPTVAGCGDVFQFDGSGSTASAGRQIVRYRWDFGDGSGVLQTVEPTTQHPYQQFGQYHPSLVVVDSQGDQSSAVQVTVRMVDANAPTAVVQAPAVIKSGQAVTFDGSQSTDPDSDCGGRIVSWTWRIDSSNPVELTSGTVSSTVFAAQLTPGIHAIKLNVTDDSGNQSALTTQQLLVTAPPTAVLIVNPSTVGCGQPLSFDGSASSAMPGRQVVLYRWNFGDGTGMLETNQPTTQHTYQHFGVYHPALTVLDSEGDASTATQATVRNVDNNIPIAVIQAPSTIADGQSVTFDGSQSTDPDGDCGGRVVQWIWQIDSGNPVSLITATVSSSLFAAQLTPGDHSLTLVVIDEAGNQSAPALHQLAVQGGTLELTIDAEPDSDVPFTLTGPPAIGSILLDGSPVTELPATKTLSLPAGTYSVVQQPVNGFGLVQLSCSDPDKQSTVNLSTRTATIKLLVGETVRCTFTSIDVSTPQVAAAALKTLHYSDIDAAGILKQFGFTATQVAAALQSQFAISADRIAECLKIADYAAMEIGVALKVALGRTALEVAISLKKLEYDAAVVAAVAAGTFTLTAAPVAAILKGALFTSAEIAAALANPLNQTSLQVVVILKGLEYSVAEIAAVTQLTFTLAAVEVAQLMILAEIAPLEVARALKEGLNQSAAQTASILKTLHFTETQIAALLRDTFNLTASQIAQLLKAVQFTEAQISAALKDALNQSATQIAVILKNVLAQSALQTAVILKNLQFTATEVAVATQLAFSLTAAQTTQVLKDAQFSATAIAVALSVGMNQTALQTAVLLKGAQFGATIVAIAIRDAFNLTPAQVVQILKDAEFTAHQIAEAMRDGLNLNATQIAIALKNILNQTPAQVTSILKGLQYSSTEVAVALKAAFNLTAAQIAQNLKDALYSVEQITAALIVGLNQSASEVATILRNLQYTATAVAAALNAGFGFTVLQIAQALKTALYTSTQITLALKDGLAQTGAQAAAILKLLGFDVTTITSRLAELYGLLAPQVASILKDLQYSVVVVATTLNVVYSLTAVQIAQILKGVGFTSTEITLALKNGLNLTAQQTAQILQQLNYGVSIIANRLAQEFALNVSQVGTILRNLQYTASEVSHGLNSAFTLNANQIAQILKSLNYASSDIATALKDDLNQSAAQAAAILQQLNYSIATISGCLANVFHVTASAAAQILYNLNATSTEISIALKNDFGRSAKQTAQILFDLGYSATTVGKRLDDVFGKSASAAAGILKDVGYGAISIATALKTAFSLSATQTVTILRDLGYSLNTLVRVLDEVFNKSASSIQSILLDIGFSLSEVLDAIRAVLGV